MKKVFVLLVMCVLVSVVQAAFIVNGGFETGSKLPGWTDTGNKHTVTTAAGGMTPRSGNYFDYLNGASWLYQTVTGTPTAGSLTGYIYMTSTDSMACFSVSGNGDYATAMIGYDSQYTAPNCVYMQHGWGQTLPAPITVTLNTWHKMEFVIDDSGMDFYWNNTLVVANWSACPNLKKIESFSIGTSWAAVSAGYDDFSFVPEPATLVLLGLGTLSVLRQRKA